MNTTGTYAFHPRIAELYDEAFERAGVAAETLGNQLLRSAHRSLRFMLNSEWSTLGVRQWMVAQFEQTMSPGMTDFILPDGVIDIIEAVLRRSGKDTEMYGISRNEYLVLTSKTDQGRPDRWYVEREAGRLEKRAFIWQAGSNSSDIMVYNAFRQIQDATAVDTTLKDDLDLPSHAFDAAADGLAYRIAIKFNAQRATGLAVAYGGQGYPDKITGGSLNRMLMEDRERGDLDMYTVYEPRTGRR